MLAPLENEPERLSVLQHQPCNFFCTTFKLLPVCRKEAEVMVEDLQNSSLFAFTRMVKEL